mgnify:CR=1 FL=1|tara:strand:- start:4650 stop:4901 length:252 start_codon:yes stop_codon:yes gene_type:complete
MLEDARAKYYDDMSELFGTKGWRDLIEELSKEVYEKQADALDATDWGQVCELRGAAKALSVLINLQEMTKLQRNNEEADNAEL